MANLKGRVLIILMIFTMVSITNSINNQTQSSKSSFVYFINEKGGIVENQFQFTIKNIKQNIISIDSLPSDLIENLRKNDLKEGLELSLVRGHLNLVHSKDFVEYKSNQRKTKTNNNININNDKSFFFDDFFEGAGSNLIFHEELLSNKETRMNFNNLMENFAETLKLPKYYHTDPSNSIKLKNNQKFYYYINDFQEIPCIDNLEAIKKLHNQKEWQSIKKLLNYQEFVESEYNIIRYFFKIDNDILRIQINVGYFLEFSQIENWIKNNPKELINTVNVVKQNHILERKELLDSYVQGLTLKMKNQILSPVTRNNEITDFGLSFNRYLKGDVFGFENFELINEIDISETTSNKGKTINLDIYDLIPEQFDILLHTIKISYNLVDEKGKIHTKYHYNSKNYKDFLKLGFEIKEIQHPIIWSYENKRKLTLKCSDITVEPNSKLVISFELRKRILSFDSLENEFEFGYFMPSGLINYKFKNENKENIHLTNQIYFNVPNVDNTMPFNIIAFTWVTFGFLFIQTLNIFLEEKDLPFFGTFKEKIKNLFKSK